MIDNHRHGTHPDIVNRLKRADGHIRKVVEMIEGGRPCLDVAQQLHAVEHAINRAKVTLIKDHMEYRVDALMGPLDSDQRSEINEFKEIAKYL